MSKLFLTTMTAFALVGLAATAIPTASAWTCVGYGPVGSTVAQTCNFAAEEGSETAGFALDQANEVVAFALSHLP